jgi:integrase
LRIFPFYPRVIATWRIPRRILWRIPLPDYPATTLALNKGKYYVLLTIPADLREHFSGRKQLKRSTGTSDLGDAKRRQHKIATELYAQLDSCKPDPRDEISNLLGWIGDADEIQRLEDAGDLEGIIYANKYAEDTSDPEDPDESCIDLVHEGGRRALEVYLDWKTTQASGDAGNGSVKLSHATDEYLRTEPYKNHKTARECEHALEQFKSQVGDVRLSEITAVMSHEFAEAIGKDKSKKLIHKKHGFVKRMLDHAVRKGWVATNVFAGIKLDKSLGTATQSYVPFSYEELQMLFALPMPDHVKKLLSILAATGMRLDEAALLNWEDIKYDATQGVTYFDLTGAIVKTKGSERRVPVHPALNWVTTGRTGQMFPEFPRDRDGKTQVAASKALMPFVRKVTKEKTKAVHSLRGNFKDMLRDADVSKEFNDFITGHGSGDVAGRYGSGPSLKARKDAIERLSFPFLT